MPSKPKPVKGKSDYSKLEKELDDLVSLYVRLRDGKCVCCGSISRLTCGHYVSRDKARLRYDSVNCNAQCWPCNVKHRHWPNFYASAMRRIYSQGVLDELDELASIPAWKWTYADLLLIRDDIREKLNRLKERIYD